jgi:4-hydroxy-2-oxoheptanedioate aldolase
MQMRRSKVLEKLRAGEVVNSFKLNLADARAAEIAARIGFDCIWTCMEHVPNDFRAVEEAIWAAKAYDTDVMVRVPRGSYSDYIRPLEMDAAGIIVPHIMSAADARDVVRMTRFHPIGRRPLDGGNADGAACMIDLKDYTEQANRERFVIIQIEDPEPLDELDEIAQIEGIDMIFFGPGDFSHSIGHVGEWDNPEISAAREKVVKTALKYGKFAGTVAGVGSVQAMVDMGYRFLNVGADVIGIVKHAQESLAAFGNIKMDAPKGIYGGDSK